MIRDKFGRFIEGQHYSSKTEFVKGKHFSPETEFKKGQHYSINTEFKGGYKYTPEEKIRMSNVAKTLGFGKWMRGRKNHISKKGKEKLSKLNRGSGGSRWKGGINPLADSLRKCAKFKIWRNIIFERDNYTCQMTKCRGGILRAHHIVPFASILNEIKYAYPDGKITYERALKYDFLWDTENGITLLKEYHIKYHKYLRGNLCRLMRISEKRTSDMLA